MSAALVVVTLGLLWPGRPARPLGSPPARGPGSHPRWGLGLLVVVLLALLLIDPILALGAGVGTWAWRKRRAATRRRQREAELVRGLPDAIDLLLLATESGRSLALAHPVVAREARGPVGEALLTAEALVTAGSARADALLTAMTPLGGGAAALGHVLADHLRYGTALVPALEAVRAEARADRRHAVQETARQVPVRLLAPLVLCVLPAFGLLTVVPLLLVSLEALPR